jgi:hypothetical protein
MRTSLRRLVKAEGKDDDDFLPSMSPIKFWSKLGGHVVKGEKGGGIHIFSGGVADSVSGFELFEALREITGLAITSPRPPLGKEGPYAWCWKSLSLGPGTPETRMYFTDTGLNSWVQAEASFDAVVDDVQRSLSVVLPRARAAASLHLVGELAQSVLFDRAWTDDAPHLKVDLEDGISAALNESPEHPALFVADFLKRRHTLRQQSGGTEDERDAEEADADADLWLPVGDQQQDELVAASSLMRTLSDFDALVRTEEQFVAQLQAIRAVYAEPLRAAMAAVRPSAGDRRLSKRPLTTIGYRKIFTDPLAVLAVHEQLLEKLHMVEEGKDVERSGASCLAEVAREERVYKNYVAGLGTTMHAIVESCEVSPIFRAFITRSREECGGRSLMDLVQLPLSRLPYYIRVLDRDVALGKQPTAVMQRLEQIRKVLTTFTEHINSWKERSVLQLHAERVLGPVPLPEGSRPLHPRDFVTEAHFIQVELIDSPPSRSSGAPETSAGAGLLFKPIQDAAVLLFRKELIILNELEYFDSVKQDVRLNRSLQIRLQLVDVHITLGEGSAQLPYLVRIHPSHPGGALRDPIYFASRGRTKQLEFYEAVTAIEAMAKAEVSRGANGGKSSSRKHR